MLLFHSTEVYSNHSFGYYPGARFCNVLHTLDRECCEDSIKQEFCGMQLGCLQAALQ